MLFKSSFLARNSSIVSIGIWAIILTYCFLAFPPSIYGVGIDRDPSWTYGLSYASMHHLVFGKDIIFTFGPLGYLLGGAALEQNFFHIYAFRILIHISFFTSIFFQLIQCKTLIQKLTLFSAVIFFLLINGGLGYQILLIALLSSLNDPLWQSHHLRKWSLCLGVLSGLTLLTQFAIGTSTFAVFLIYLSVGFYRAVESKRSIRHHALAIANFLIAAASTLVIFLHPDRAQGFLIIAACLALAGCLSLTLWASIFFNLSSILSKLNIKPLGHEKAQGNKGTRTGKLASEHSFYLAYSLGLIAIVLYFSPSTIGYLRGGLEITSGYSSAMVIVGSGVELGCAIFIILLTLALIVTSLKLKDLSLSLCLVLVLLLIFKHGFVRADGHVTIFASLAPLLIALCFTQATCQVARTRCFLGYLCALMVIMLGFSPGNIGSPESRLIQLLAPDSVFSRLASWSNPIQYKVRIAQDSRAQLSKVKFPVEMRQVIGDRPVDIIPSEISLVAANNLNWKSRPVFQSYAAYTQFLDNANFDSLSKRDRDYIVYSFNSIDERHPFFDEPKTFFNLFCNYKFLAKFPDFAQMPGTQFALLEKRSTDICLPGAVQSPKALAWKVDEVLETNDQAIERASFEFKYSLLGKIYKTLFRAPPIQIWVNYIDGSRGIYRMVPGNAFNGIIVSHLARNDREAFSLFNNVLPPHVKSFSLHTNNPLVYQKTIGLQLSLYSQAETFSNPPSFVSLSQLKDVKFLPTVAESTIGSVDSIKASKSRETITLSGWAARKTQDAIVPTWLLVTDGAENKPLGILRTGEGRPDVARFLHEPRYALSGWSGTLNASGLTHGDHVVKVWFFDPDTNAALPMTIQSIRVN